MAGSGQTWQGLGKKDRTGKESETVPIEERSCLVLQTTLDRNGAAQSVNQREELCSQCPAQPLAKGAPGTQTCTHGLGPTDTALQEQVRSCRSAQRPAVPEPEWVQVPAGHPQYRLHALGSKTSFSLRSGQDRICRHRVLSPGALSTSLLCDGQHESTERKLTKLLQKF